MKSIKPGRGPSAMGAVGCVFAAIFGIFWIGMVEKIGAPSFFTLFGVFFIVMAIIQGVMNFKNATGKNRYSIYDITDDQEEVDPFQERFGEQVFTEEKKTKSSEFKYCPYCGRTLDHDYKFCPECGKNLKK